MNTSRALLVGPIFRSVIRDEHRDFVKQSSGWVGNIRWNNHQNCSNIYKYWTASILKLAEAYLHVHWDDPLHERGNKRSAGDRSSTYSIMWHEGSPKGLTQGYPPAIRLDLHYYSNFLCLIFCVREADEPECSVSGSAFSPNVENPRSLDNEWNTNLII